jgi:hypothetical protein
VDEVLLVDVDEVHLVDEVYNKWEEEVGLVGEVLLVDVDEARHVVVDEVLDVDEARDMGVHNLGILNIY